MTLTQLNIFEQPPAQKHSVTSREAAESVKPSAGMLRERVLACIRDNPCITDEQIVKLTGIPANTARPRRVELMQAGLIRKGGVSRRTLSGRKATAWIVA